MRSVWDRLSSRWRTDQRPRRGRRPPSLESLETRQLPAVVFFPPPAGSPPNPKITISGQPPFVTNPKILLPADGSYRPITVSGEFSQIVTANLDGPYAIHPGPFIAQAKAELANLPPQPKGSPLPVIKVPIPAQDLFALGDPSQGINNGVVETRLADRPIPGAAILQVTDQYRQDEPLVFAPIQNVQMVFQVAYTPYFVTVDHKTIVIQTPTAIQLIRNYTYSFSFHLQAEANPGTNGRQYAVTIYDVDGESGGQSNFAIYVPNQSTAPHATRK
jgi:hypothetical protein